MDWISDPGIWASFLTLSALEIVLGIDNVIFISIVAARLPKEQQFKARAIGLAGALLMRVAFLSSVVWLAKATEPLVSLFDHTFSTRDLILLAGGAFLLYKGTQEIHDMVEGSGMKAGDGGAPKKPVSMGSAIFQIMLLDLVFSIDSVITAVGLTDKLPIMIAAIVVAIVIMLVAAGALGRFIEHHPTVKMLALAFLLLVGVALVADAFHFHIPRGYLYFAIAFSAAVEFLNITISRRSGGGGAAPGSA